MIIDAHVHIFEHACPRVAPPDYADGCFPVERLLALMDSAGVDKAMLLQNPAIGLINDQIAAAIEAHPSRFVGTVQVDPTAPNAGGRVRAVVERSPRFRALKLELSEAWGWTGKYPRFRLDRLSLEPLWEAAAELSLVVIIDPGPPGNRGYQVEAIDRLAASFPQISFLLEHLGYLLRSQRDDDEAMVRRVELLQLAHCRNVFLGFSAVSTLLEESYPSIGALRLLREAVELVGAHKILWGTDAPYTLRHGTYTQLLDLVRTDAGFLSAPELDLILGLNAQKLFFREE